MIQLLSKIFIKNREDVANPGVRKAYGTLCGLTGIFLNICLFAGKYFAGMISGSIAITADAFNNLSDAGSSFITLVGFWLAGKKPDPDHPFGHGRFEYISGFVVSMAILLMGLELGKSSVSKIFHPVPVDTGGVAMGILVVSVLVKGYMAFYNRVIGNKIDSAAMRATSADSISDMVATGVVFLSMLVNRFAHINIDGICGVLVAVFILYTGVEAAKETLGALLGTAPDREYVQEIRNLVMAHEGVKGIHDLIVHDYGPGRRMISLHAEVPGDGDVYVMHDMIDCIERELRQKLQCDATIHMDPIEVDNEQLNEMKEKVFEEGKIPWYQLLQFSSHKGMVLSGHISGLKQGAVSLAFADGNCAAGHITESGIAAVKEGAVVKTDEELT